MKKQYFGYIEGYYGRMLSWDERAYIVERMKALSLNTYLYAPKEDALHRIQWRIPYPRRWTSAFSLFVKKAENAGISVIPGIAPGLSFDYTSAADYAALLRKCLALAKAGVPALCLLMDDIPIRLPQKSEKAFPSLGWAHGGLLGKLSVDLKKNFPKISLWFCPTVYADQFVDDDPAARGYLDDLAASMPPSVIVLWTGSRVISKEISARSLRTVAKLFKGGVCIWDNIYANDYCPRRLFIGSYKYRDADLLKSVRGILLNPTGLPRTDAFLLSLLSGYRAKKNPEKSWRLAVSELSVSREVKTVAPFFDFPAVKLPRAALSLRYRSRVKKALKKLLWEWKAPLQCEWYPFLYSLGSDIELWESGSGRRKHEWIRKKYPPVLANFLCKSSREGFSFR